MVKLRDMQGIDIGINLMNKQYPDRQQLIKESMEQGYGMIITGCDIKSNSQALALCEKMAKEGYEVYATVGLHPHNAKYWNENTKNTIIEQLQSPYAIAIGEMGLDYDRMYSTKEKQLRCFSELLDLAEDYNKPLFLHERSAETDFIRLMKKHKDLCKRSVAHCFYGSKETATRYTNMGMYIGLTGIVTNPKRNTEIKESVKFIRNNRLLVETDGPYMIPAQEMGKSKRSVPSNIKYVIDDTAKFKGISSSQLAVEIFDNTLNFFQLKYKNEKLSEKN